MTEKDWRWFGPPPTDWIFLAYFVFHFSDDFFWAFGGKFYDRAVMRLNFLSVFICVHPWLNFPRSPKKFALRF
jgi:hypothetical protein